MISVRFPASSRLDHVLDRRVAASRCPAGARRRGARRSGTPIAELRPSSATAIPMKPICETWMSSTPSRNCQPRMSIAPASPAKVPEIAIASDVAPLHVHAAVAGRLRVEARRPHLVAEGRPVEDQPEDDGRGERDEEADVQSLEHRVAPEDRQVGALGDVARDRNRLVGRVLKLPALADEGLRRPRSRSSSA